MNMKKIILLILLSLTFSISSIAKKNKPVLKYSFELISKLNNDKAKLVSFLAVIVAIAAVYLSKLVGTSGGEIRHTEIREDSTNSKALPENSTIINADKDHEDK